MVDGGIGGSFLTGVLAANNSKAQEVVVILDSCMSGALGQLPQLGSEKAHLREGVAVLTASRSGQASVKSGSRGLFTELVCGVFQVGGADVLGQVTVLPFMRTLRKRSGLGTNAHYSRLTFRSWYRSAPSRRWCLWPRSGSYPTGSPIRPRSFHLTHPLKIPKSPGTQRTRRRSRTSKHAVQQNWWIRSARITCTTQP